MATLLPTCHSVNKLTALAAAVALSGGLAACGGGGGSTDESTMQTPQEMCESAGNTWVDGACMTDEQLAAAAKAREAMAIANAIAAAKTAVDGLTDASSDADIMAASNAIMAAHNAITGAQHASASDTADSLDALDAIRMSLTSAQGGIDEHRQAAKDAANKVALSKKSAIETEADATTTAARPFDLDADPSDPPTAAENYVVSVEHTGSAVEVTVTDGALPADNDPMFEQAATFGNGQMLVRNIGTDRKIIVLHTDIEADDKAAFSSEYELTVDRDTDTTANDTYAVLADDNDVVASSRFPSGASTTRTYVVYDADTAAGRASQFAGSLQGADGMFRCVATGGCTVATDAMGDFNALTAGEWEFTPNAGAMIDVADDDYLTYGFWLDTTTKDGAIASYDTVQTFATSSLTEASSLGTVTGSAEYAGGAAGVYVHETTNEDSTLNTATSGRFTADVALTAYFEATTLRTDNTIEGTISNFDLDGGPDTEWNVDVAATFGDDGAIAAGATASGMTGDAGSLSGQFHGADADDTTAAPLVLIGEFNANFVNGLVAGAYGARVEE